MTLRRLIIAVCLVMVALTPSLHMALTAAGGVLVSWRWL